jgi:hypothetical protein
VARKWPGTDGYLKRRDLWATSVHIRALALLEKILVDADNSVSPNHPLNLFNQAATRLSG